jgi:hypothetical protein
MGVEMENGSKAIESSDSLFTVPRPESENGTDAIAGERFRERVVQGALRGAIASMAMTGMREFTRHVNLLEEPPPEAIVRQKLVGRFRSVQRGPRRAQAEIAHWSFGAAAGAVFATLPRALRRGAWSGPLYGLLVWTSFELGIAQLLGLSQARRLRKLDRLALAGDHLLYGFLLSENATLRR